MNDYKVLESRQLGGLWLVLILAAVLGQLAGCGAGNPHPVGSYDRAQLYLEKGKNLEAVAALEAFIRKNPTDSLAAEAQYQKSLLYIEMKEYPLAAVEFQILRKDYPISDRVEDAFFQEGVANYLRVGKVQRDVTGAREARVHFHKFLQQYPSSKHLPEVERYLQEIADLLVRKRLQQAKVFWQLKRFAAIDITLKTALEEEAGSSLLDQVMWERARAALKQDKPEIAVEMYSRLIQEYPDSPYLDRSREALKELTAQEQAPAGDSLES